jgi:hypothetical protein
MPMPTMQDELLATLAEGYERDPGTFVTLPKKTVDSSEARVIVADMRNQGYVEEQVRGVVRLTSRGYKLCRGHLLISA